jgi:hypothetical protein
MTSRCPTILTANPASIAIGGGISSTIQNRTHRHSPPSPPPPPPPPHSHFLSAANSLDLRLPKRLLHHQNISSIFTPAFSHSRIFHIKPLLRQRQEFHSFSSRFLHTPPPSGHQQERFYEYFHFQFF